MRTKIAEEFDRRSARAARAGGDEGAFSFQREKPGHQ
jgi:hypothetical protein